MLFILILLVTNMVSYSISYKQGYEDSFNRLTNMMVDENQWDNLVDLVNERNGAFNKYWENKENEQLHSKD